MRVNNSGFYGEKQITSDIHRTLGKSICMTNLDCLEYHYVNGEIVFVALIDYKEGCAQNTEVGRSSIQARTKLATGLSLPYFHTKTYLDQTLYPIPMYFVIPKNNLAKDLFIQTKQNTDGEWMSVSNYSRFQHYLRKILPNENEIKHLSNKYKEY
jgi:hypothetical protein